VFAPHPPQKLYYRLLISILSQIPVCLFPKCVWDTQSTVQCFGDFEIVCLVCHFETCSHHRVLCDPLWCRYVQLRERTRAPLINLLTHSHLCLSSERTNLRRQLPLSSAFCTGTQQFSYLLSRLFIWPLFCPRFACFQVLHFILCKYFYYDCDFLHLGKIVFCDLNFSI